jgi:hypothetical protein
MAGAAWASVVAQYTGAAAFVWVVYSRRASLGLAAALEGPHKRALAAAASPGERAALASAGRLQRLGLLLRDLQWLAFVKQAAALTLRGVLILSTYTGASMVRRRQQRHCLQRAAATAHELPCPPGHAAAHEW